MALMTHYTAFHIACFGVSKINVQAELKGPWQGLLEESQFGHCLSAVLSDLNNEEITALKENIHKYSNKSHADDILVPKVQIAYMLVDSKLFIMMVLSWLF